jgi:hypothetical protein
MCLTHMTLATGRSHFIGKSTHVGWFKTLPPRCTNVDDPPPSKLIAYLAPKLTRTWASWLSVGPLRRKLEEERLSIDEQDQ